MVKNEAARNRKDSVARMEASGRGPLKPGACFWFEEEHPEQVAYRACVAKHGTQNIREEIYVGLKEDGETPELWRVVMDRKSGAVLGEFNYSFICPPVCPPTGTS